MKNFINTLEKYYKDGLLYRQTHPTLPLTIWNYTPKVQYENIWDEVTLQCRGLVTDNEGNIVARPFKKFFNMEEGKHTPTSEFEVYDKMDGSLGILFYYEYELSEERRYNIWFSNNYETGMERFFDPNNLPNYDDPYWVPTPKTKGEWVLSTRGSFTSEQSIKGFEMLENYNYEKLHKDYTYLFEIIYDQNRIVVDYPFEDLILLGMIETKTGYEIDLHGEGNDVRLKNLIHNLEFKVVKRYDGINDYSILKGLIKDNEEGFVIRFSNGDRMKIKGEEYLRLHKIMTNVSTTGIWEMLSNGDDVNELLKDVPDEFYKKIKDYAGNLRHNHHQISEYCGKIHDQFRYGKYNDVEVEPTKKEYAQYIFRSYDSKYHPILFAMWDKKNYDKIIWNALKPEFSKL
jgi:RNA ligase